MHFLQIAEAADADVGVAIEKARATIDAAIDAAAATTRAAIDAGDAAGAHDALDNLLSLVCAHSAIDAQILARFT